MSGVLVVVLLLVLAAGGVLAGSVLTDQPDWAWLSVLLSVVGAVLLVLSRVRRRRATRSSRAEPASGESSEAAASSSDVPPESVRRSGTTREQGAVLGVENTDAADARALADSQAEVFVIDEQPRYHVAVCRWLEGRTTVLIPLAEARELGFSPCAVCGPDATLARRSRAAG